MESEVETGGTDDKGKVDPLHLSELITFLRHSHSLFVCHGQPFTRHPRPSVVTPSVVRREPARSTLRLSGSVTLHPRSSGSATRVNGEGWGGM